MQRIFFFIKFFIWFSLRNMRKHPGRALTVLCGIALGAAVFTSVRLSVHASLDSFTRSMDMIAGRADRVLIQPGGHVPEKLIPMLLKLPAVVAASPILTTYVKPVQPPSDPFLLIGFDPALDRPHRDWQISDAGGPGTDAWLELIRDPNTLIIGQPLALKYKCGRGESLTLLHANQTAEFRVAGVLRPEGLALVEGGRVAITDIATFQEFTGLYGRVDRVDLRLKPDTGERELAEIRRMLPDSVVLSSPSAAKKSGQGMIRAYQLNLSILSFASLFVGMFLVYSLVALNAASRRHELAVLRSVGASPYLLFIIFLAEGALFGLAGWMAALPISSFLVKYLLHGVSQTISILFVRVQVDRLSLSIWEITLSFVLTVFISVLAALQPAREAMLVSPKEALEISQHGMQV
jgi:putative ABC transport system permease protein